MGSNDENEIIKISCERCKKSESGTYKELFGDLLGLIALPKIKCVCGGDITLELTGAYK